MFKEIKIAAYVIGIPLTVVFLDCDQKTDSAASSVDTTRYEYDLSRILFLLPDVHEVPSVQDTKEILEQHKRKVALDTSYREVLESAKIVEHSMKPVIEGTNDFALITYNGNTLSNSQVRQTVQLVQDLERFKSRKGKDNARKCAKIARETQKRAIGAFIRAQVYDGYAKTHQISVDESLLASNKVSFAKRHHCPNYKTLKERLSAEEAALLDRMMRDAILSHDVQEDMLKRADLAVSDQELAATMARFERIYKTAVATNTLVYATASNAYERILSHEITFEEAFQDYNQDDAAEDDGSWCTVSLNQLTHDDQFALAEYLRTANPGDVLPPMELDNALCIVKVTAKRVATDKEKPAAEESPEDQKTEQTANEKETE